jgi:uncharacterized protein
MKKALIFGLVAALALGLSMMPASAEAKTYKVKIGGGPTGGTFNTFANGAAVYIPKVNKDIKASAVGSGGSVENVKRVSQGQSTIGMCYAVDSALGFAGKLPKDPKKYNKLRSMGYLYGAPAQLIVRADSPYQSAKDLVGKRVALGNAGSGAAASAQRFFGHLGTLDKMKTTFLGYSAAARAFKDGKLDAFWLLVGYPNRAVIEASVQVKIRLIDVHKDAVASGFYKAYAYAPTTIPANTYFKGMPPCETFQDSTILSTNKDQSEDLVYKIMKTLWSEKGMEAMVAAKKTFKAMTLQNNFRGASVPMHKGAYKFWIESGMKVPDSLKPID